MSRLALASRRVPWGIASQMWIGLIGVSVEDVQPIYFFKFKLKYNYATSQV